VPKEKPITFIVHEDSELAEYDEKEARYKCPECEVYAATRHSGKKIGDCNHCGAQLAFQEKTAAFVRPVGDADE